MMHASASTGQIARLFDRAMAERPLLQGRVTGAPFETAVARSLAHRFRDQPQPPARDVARYLDSLHAGDLALACACARGDEAAWEQFVAEFRPLLRRAARAIAGDEAAGHELADSLYAELFGINERRGASTDDVASSPQGRRSLFEYFHGRSRLSTWLRAVLAQRHVDARRAARRFVALDDDTEAAEDVDLGAHGGEAADPRWRTVAPDPDRERYLTAFERALGAAVEKLDARDRLRLACYYLQQMTLAQIGLVLGEHEATVSRKLDRTRRRLRQDVERALVADARLSDPEIRLCYQYALEDARVDLARALGVGEG